MNKQQFMTAKQFAEQLQVSHGTVQRQLRSGGIRGIKVAGGTYDQWRIPVSEFEYVTTHGWRKPAEQEQEQ